MPNGIHTEMALSVEQLQKPQNEEKKNSNNIVLLALALSTLTGATENAKGSMETTAPKGSGPVADIPVPQSEQQLYKDYDTWLETQSELQSMMAEIKKLLAEVKDSKDPMLAAQMLMLAVMQYKGEQMAGFAAVSNIDTDLRNAVGSALSSFQEAGGAGAENFVSEVNAIHNFVNLPGMSSLIGSSTVDSINSSIETIKSQFVISGNSIWGYPGSVGAIIQEWQVNANGGKYFSGPTTIQSSLSALNQTFSSLATSTTTELQFEGKQYQEFMTQVSNGFQTMVGLDKTMVTNQRTQ